MPAASLIHAEADCNDGLTTAAFTPDTSAVLAGDFMVMLSEEYNNDFALPSGWSIDASGAMGFAGTWRLYSKVAASDAEVVSFIPAGSQGRGCAFAVVRAPGGLTSSQTSASSPGFSDQGVTDCSYITDDLVLALGVSENSFNSSGAVSSWPSGFSHDADCCVPSVNTIGAAAVVSALAAAAPGSVSGLHWVRNTSVVQAWRSYSLVFAGGTPCTPPTNDTPPTLAGSAEVGQTLTVTEGAYSGDATITLAHQWFRFCGTGPEEEIVGETGLTYEQVEADIDCDVFVRETASNGCAPDDIEDTNSVGPVVCGVPSEVSPPAVTGVVSAGHILEGAHGSYSCSPSGFAEQWYLDCGGGPVAVVGETGLTFTTDETMIGCTVLLGEVPSNGDGDGAESFSAPFGPIQANVPAAVRFYQSPPWRFVILNLKTFETLSFLDHIATDRSITYTLNSPAVALCKVPSDEPEVNIPWPTADDEPFLAEGTRALLGFRREGVAGSDLGPWVIRFAGIIQQLEDTAEADNSFSHLTAYDPWQYLMSRPVRNGADFDYTLPGVDGSSYTATRIDVIIGEIIHNTIAADGIVGIDTGPLYGGTALWGGTIEECDQIDINFQSGTTVGEAIQQLTQTDQCDVLLLPIYDPVNRPGYLVELNIFNQAGAVIDDAIFAWDKPSRSLSGISRMKDGTGRANVVKFYAGTAGLASGGRNIGPSQDAASILKYGAYWATTFWPSQNVAGAVNLLAQTQLALRKDGKTTVAISPAPQRSPIPFQDYFLGDRVPVYASDRFREPLPPGGVEGVEYQRIYGIPILIDDDQTERIEQMLTAVTG